MVPRWQSKAWSGPLQVTWHQRKLWKWKWKCEMAIESLIWSATSDLAPEEAKLGAVNRIGSSPTIPPFGVQPFFNSSIFLRGFVFVFGIVFWLSAVCLRGKLGQQGLRHVGPQFVIDLFSIFVDVNLFQLFEKSWTEANKAVCSCCMYKRSSVEENMFRNIWILEYSSIFSPLTPPQLRRELPSRKWQTLRPVPGKTTTNGQNYSLWYSRKFFWKSENWKKATTNRNQ